MQKITKQHYQKLVTAYDGPSTLLAVTIYPRRGEVYSAGKSGIASYAKNVFRSMDHRVVVFTDYDRTPEMYEEGNVLVIRCFKNGTVNMYKDLYTAINKFTVSKTFLVQYDFSLYGNIFVSGLMIPFLMLLTGKGFEVTAVIHNVVTDVHKIAGHVGITNTFGGHLQAILMNFIFHVFYSMLDMAVQRVVVLEEQLKHKLVGLVNPEKIMVIPHGVDTNINPIDMSKARKILNMPRKKFIVLFFGYVNWLKGADLFTSYYKKTNALLGRKTKFIIAGGESPTLKGNHYYQTYFTDLTATVEESEEIEMTGYVPQRKLSLYFSAADLVVMPYRHFMNASGVLSLIFSHKKPFIISEHIGELFTSGDFRESFISCGFKPGDITFKESRKSCISVTEKVLKNGLKQKMSCLATLMRSKRSYARVGTMYDEMLFTPAYKIAPKQSFSYT